MASHTATGEWKSFEVRMRRRRAERLLLRADLAVTNGFLDEAKASLEELRAIAPSMPGIAAVEHRLNAQAPPISYSSSLSKRFALPALAAAATIALAFGIWMRPQTVPAAQDFRGLTLTPPAVASGRAPAAPAIAPAVQTSVTPRPDATMAVMEKAAPPRPHVAPGEIADDFVARPRAAIGTVTAAAAPVEPITVPPPARPLNDAAPGPGSTPSLRTAAAESAVATTGTTLRVTDPTPAPGSDAGVRGTLDRYAAAYNDLDATAAQHVWPRVNRAALSRAFDSLASQRVSLGECRIDVRGSAARAACAGSATWAPKVGDATPRTEARQWTFDLVRAGEAWEIVNARVQNK